MGRLVCFVLPLWLNFAMRYWHNSAAKAPAIETQFHEKQRFPCHPFTAVGSTGSPQSLKLPHLMLLLERIFTSDPGGQWPSRSLDAQMDNAWKDSRSSINFLLSQHLRNRCQPYYNGSHTSGYPLTRRAMLAARPKIEGAFETCVPRTLVTAESATGRSWPAFQLSSQFRNVTG